LPLTIAVDRLVRKRQSPAFALQNLALDVAEKELSGFLGVSNLAQSIKEFPSDLKRAFYQNRKWFGHDQKRRPGFIDPFYSVP
jgi:hypothetical protein